MRVEPGATVATEAEVKRCTATVAEERKGVDDPYVTPSIPTLPIPDQ